MLKLDIGETLQRNVLIVFFERVFGLYTLLYEKKAVNL